jgi:hypothetical protein
MKRMIVTTAKAVKIAGIIVPANWDRDGNITGAAIQSYDECEYIIEYDNLDRILNKFIQKPVVVTGNIREPLDGNKFIGVLSVKTIPNSDINNYVDGVPHFERRSPCRQERIT